MISSYNHVMTSEKKARRKVERIPVSQEQLERTVQIVESGLNDSPDVFSLPASRVTPDDLTDYFTKTSEVSARILPKERRRYAIYCRKSTDTEDRQVRSLPDQIEECLAKAKRLGIKVRPEDIIQESASAKKSGNRPLFDQMLRDFRVGKYH